MDHGALTPSTGSKSSRVPGALAAIVSFVVLAGFFYGATYIGAELIVHLLGRVGL